MGLIVILVWFGDFVKRHGGSNNFRSGQFDSRLASGNSRFELLREFSRNKLISLSFFAGEWRFSERIRRNSRHNGKSREFCSIQCNGSARVSLRLQPTQHDPVELFGALDIGEMPRVRDFLVAAT